MSAKENPSPDAMLDSVAALIREFLVCDHHQLTVLTPWVLHTWVYQVFPTTPYLHIHSPEPESPDSIRRKVVRGYRLCDFQDAWERYLPALSSIRLREIADRAFEPCPIGAPAPDVADVTRA